MITITINTHYSAFDDNPHEVADILAWIAKYYRANDVLPDNARDSNGNTVCHIEESDL